MNTPQFTVVKDRKAPVQAMRCSGTSFWRDLFESMQVGDWFVLSKADLHRVKMSAGKYLRGRYRCYMNTEVAGTWVFTKIK
jgi:hypothetical protein